MGKKDKWGHQGSYHGGYQQGYESRSWVPHYGQRGQKDKGKDQTGQFPSYDTEWKSKDIELIQETRTSEPQSTPNTFTKRVQTAVNHARKHDVRVARLTEEHAVKERRWKAYTVKMQQAFMQEHARHRNNLAKLKKEIAEATEAQHVAQQQLRDVFAAGATGGQAAGAQEAAFEDWQAMMAASHSMELDEELQEEEALLYAQRVLAAPGLEPGASTNLPRLGAGDQAPAPATPPHKPNGGLPWTPQATSYVPVQQGGERVTDPYMVSPLTAALAAASLEREFNKGPPAPGTSPAQGHFHPGQATAMPKQIPKVAGPGGRSPVKDIPKAGPFAIWWPAVEHFAGDIECPGAAGTSGYCVSRSWESDSAWESPPLPFLRRPTLDVYRSAFAFISVQEFCLGATAMPVYLLSCYVSDMRVDLSSPAFFAGAWAGGALTFDSILQIPAEHSVGVRLLLWATPLGKLILSPSCGHSPLVLLSLGRVGTDPPWSIWLRADPPRTPEQSERLWLVAQEDYCWLLRFDGPFGDQLKSIIADRIGRDEQPVAFAEVTSSVDTAGVSVGGVDCLALDRVPAQGERPPDGASATDAQPDLCPAVDAQGVRKSSFDRVHGARPESAVSDHAREEQQVSSEVADEVRLGIYASAVASMHEAVPVNHDPAETANARSGKAWFLLFAPDRVPEEVRITVDPPIHLEDVRQNIENERLDGNKVRFGHVVPVHPQPSHEFGSLLCLPDWAVNQVTILVDCRSYDVRLFCMRVDPWMQWGSFALHAHLPQGENFDLIVRGLIHPRGRPLMFSQGDLVVVQDVGGPLPPFLNLSDLLLSCESFEAEAPQPVSPSFSNFLVLNDGGPRGLKTPSTEGSDAELSFLSALVTQCPDEHPPDFRLLEDCRVQPFTLPLAFPDPRWCDQPVMCKVKAALPLTHLKSIFSAVCVQRPVWGISELITCKLLDEPIPGGIADEVCIAHLRYVAQQLGPEWHYVPPRDAIFIRDGDSSDDSDLAETEHDCEDFLPATQTLAYRLLIREGADFPPEDVRNQDAKAYLLVTDLESVLFFTDFARPTEYRAQISSCLGIPENKLRLFPATPRVVDASVDGVDCRTVIAAFEFLPGRAPDAFGILVDARAVHRGWRAVQVYAASISCFGIVRSLQGAGLEHVQLGIEGVEADTDILGVHPGQVLVVLAIERRLIEPLHAESFDAVEAAPGGQPTGEVLDDGPRGLAPDQSRIDASLVSREAQASNSVDSEGLEQAAVTEVAPPSVSQETAYFDATFVLLKQSFVPELVTIRVPEGIDTQEALQSIAAARDPLLALRMPALQEVRQQPRGSHALIVCTPEWPIVGSVVVVDSRALTGGLFAIHLVGTLNRADLLVAAGIPEIFPVDVYYGDVPWPLPHDGRVQVQTGDLLQVVPQGYGPVIISCLSDMLRSSTGWSSEVDVSPRPGDIGWVIGPDGPFGFIVCPSREWLVREDLGRLLNIPPRELVLQPAIDGLRDFVTKGLGQHIGGPTCYADGSYKAVLAPLTGTPRIEGVHGESDVASPMKGWLWLLVLFKKGTCQILFAGLHAPHRGHPPGEISEWWNSTEALLHRESRGRLLVVGADCNTSIGSVESRHVAGAEPEVQDHAGDCLHSLLHKCELWAPATWPQIQHGAGWTYVQRRNGALSRPDFVLLPLVWQSGVIQAWTAPGITAANMVVDHLATLVDVRIQVSCGLGPSRKATRRIDARALSHPANRDQLRLFIELFVRGFRHRSAAVVFADVASAYYSARRELAVRHPSDAAHGQRASQEGFETDCLEEQLALPSALEQEGASGWLKALTTVINEDTWMCLQNDDTPVQTRRGTRAGSAWADLTFARILKVKASFQSSPQVQSGSAQVQWDGRRDWTTPESPSTSVPLSELIWADDLAACVEADLASDLPRAVGVEVGALDDAFQCHGFDLSYGPRKTAAILCPRGKGSREVRRRIFQKDPSIPMLREHAGASVLPVVDSYRHLGVIHMHDGGMRQEIRQRCALAWTAFREGRSRVFRCRRVAVARRGVSLDTLVISKLRFGCGAWPPLGCAEGRLFGGTLFSLYRATLGLSHRDDQHISLATCCALLCLLDHDSLLKVEQLRYLRQLVAHAPDVLWALLRQDTGYLRLLRDALEWLYARVGATSNLPHPLENVEPWCEVC
ncbi:unnamed protein product, partial [Symbiodinium sp. KB8]